MTDPFKTFVPLRLRRRQGRLVNTAQTAYDPVLLEAIGRAFHWQSLLDAGKVQSIAAIGRLEGLNPASVSRILQLALLSPQLIGLLMSGRQPRTLTLESLKRHRLPNDWQAQREMLNPFDG